MNSVNFFNPVYIIPSKSEPGEKAMRVSFKEKIVNFAELTFALGNAYQVSKIGKEVTQFTTKYKHKNHYLIRGFIRVAIVVAFVAISMLFPPIILIPTSLFFVKLIHRQGRKFTPIEDKPPIHIDDAQLAKKICEEDLILLKEDGALFQKILVQIQKINQGKNSQAGATLYAHLSTYQSYYAAMLDNEDYKDFNGMIYEVIESIGRLKSSIDYKIRGIINVGNSCYINSAMQALLAIPEVNQKLAVLDESTLEGTQKEIAVSVKKFVAAYNLDFAPEEAMINAAEGMQQACLNSGLILPAADECKDLEATIQFFEAEGGNVEGMKKELAKLKAAGKNYIIKSQGDPMELIDKVLELIGSTIPLTLECRAVGDPALIPNIEETNFSSLRIQLKETDHNLSFTDLLKRYFAPRIEGEDRIPMTFALENGFPQPVSHWTQEARIKGEPPAYLIVQLNRRDGDLGELRINTPINLKVGETFDFSEYFEEMPPSAAYEACAVILHKGDSRQGHYYAIRKDAEANWYECDDLDFKKLKKEEAEQHMGLGSIFILERKALDLGTHITAC